MNDFANILCADGVNVRVPLGIMQYIPYLKAIASGSSDHATCNQASHVVNRVIEHVAMETQGLRDDLADDTLFHCFFMGVKLPLRDKCTLHQQFNGIWDPESSSYKCSHSSGRSAPREPAILDYTAECWRTLK
jgi:hypothetical protein